jgi:hypothetical protein
VTLRKLRSVSRGNYGQGRRGGRNGGRNGRQGGTPYAKPQIKCSNCKKVGTHGFDPSSCEAPFVNEQANFVKKQQLGFNPNLFGTAMSANGFMQAPKDPEEIVISSVLNSDTFLDTFLDTVYYLSYQAVVLAQEHLEHQ